MWSRFHISVLAALLLACLSGVQCAHKRNKADFDHHQAAQLMKQMLDKIKDSKQQVGRPSLEKDIDWDARIKKMQQVAAKRKYRRC